MVTIAELIKDNSQRAIRRVYIKRRSLAGAYETNWYQIDKLYGIDQVVSYGSASAQIDSEQGRIGSFTLSGITIQMRNDLGFFNREDDERSIWSGYLCRKYTKIKVDCGYYDEDFTEVGVATVFEGVIDAITTADDQKAQIRALPYTSILKAYDISDLGLTGKKSINTIVDLIMNQSKISSFIPYVASNAANNVDITDTSLITGDYWLVLTDLAYKSASIPFLNGSIWSFAARTPGAVSVYDLEGRGNSAQSDLFSIEKYEDGEDKVRVNWIVTGTNITAVSADPILLLKYLGQPEEIDLSDVDLTAQKQAIVNSLLALWQYPKRRITVKTRFFINQISPMDKISIRVKGQYSPQNTMIWDANLWDDGSVWGQRLGALILSDKVNFMVTKIEKDISGWINTITAEEIL